MKKITKAVIPVAGFGTRFLPATIAQPKEMLPVVDKPIIQYIVEEMVEAGITEIIFVTGRGKRAIEDHFDFSWELETLLKERGKEKTLNEIKKISDLAKFVYVRQNKPLGNGHALLCAREVVGDEPFAFSYGDDIVTGSTPAISQLIEGFNKYNTIMVGTMEVDPSAVSAYGVVKPKNNDTDKKFFEISDLVEKPEVNEAPSNMAMFGRFIFTPEIFSELEKTKPGKGGEIWVADAVSKILSQRGGYACRMEKEFYDCGKKLEYLKANACLALKHKDLGGKFREYLKSLEL